MAENTKGSSGIFSRLFHWGEKKERPKSETDEKVSKTKSRFFIKEQMDRQKAISSDDIPKVSNSIGSIGRSSVLLNPSKESEARNSLAQTDLSLAFLPFSPAVEVKKTKKENTKFTVVNVSNISPSPNEFESIFSPSQFFSNAEIDFVFKIPSSSKETVIETRESPKEEAATTSTDEAVNEATTFIPKNVKPFEWFIEYLQKNLEIEAKYAAKEQIERLKKPLNDDELDFLRTLIENHQQSWRTLTDAKPFMAKQTIEQKKLAPEIEVSFNSLVQEVSNLKTMNFDEAYKKCYNDIGFNIIISCVPTYDYLSFLASIGPILHNGIKNLIVKLGEKSFRIKSVEKQKFTFLIKKTDSFFSITHSRELNIVEIMPHREIRETRSYTQISRLSPDESFEAFEKKTEENTQYIGTCFATVMIKKDTKIVSTIKTITFKPGKFHPDVMNTEKQKQIELAFQSLDNVSSHPRQRRLTKNKSPQQS